MSDDDLLETVAENRARRFVEYLQSEAGHTPTLRLGDHIGVINEVQYRLAHDGFNTNPTDGGDERVSVFASAAFVADLREEAADFIMSGGDDSARGTRVHGARVFADGALEADELIAIHHDAIIPQRTGYAWRPYLVRTPAGVVAATIEQPDD